MSLRSFHIFFICVSFVLSVMVGAWGIVDYRRGHDASHLYVGLVCLATAILLVVYATRAFRKLRMLGP